MSTAPGQRSALTISGLQTKFHTPQGELTAVDGIDLTVHRGSIVGLVGESGCGKSVTALSVLGLVPAGGQVRSASRAGTYAGCRKKNAASSGGTGWP